MRATLSWEQSLPRIAFILGVFLLGYYVGCTPVTPQPIPRRLSRGGQSRHSGTEAFDFGAASLRDRVPAASVPAAPVATVPAAPVAAVPAAPVAAVQAPDIVREQVEQSRRCEVRNYQRAPARPAVIESSQCSKNKLTGTLYEHGYTAMVPALVCPGQVVLDIGSNAGNFALPFAQSVGPTGYVYAFDLLGPNIKKACAKLRKHDCTNNVLMVQAAVADVHGAELEITLQGESTSFTSRVEDHDGHKNASGKRVSLRSITIGEFFKDSPERIAAIKIDVEGGAAPIIEGMMDLLLRDEPIIFFERHYVREETDVLKLLRPLNWTWYSRVNSAAVWSNIAQVDPSFPLLKHKEKFDTDGVPGQRVPYLNIIVPPSKEFRMRSVMDTRWNLDVEGKPYRTPPHCSQ